MLKWLSGSRGGPAYVPPEGGDGGGWTPADLFVEGQVGAWFDPSDRSTVFEDSSGSSPASPGGPVGLILDKSGNAFNAVQATTARKPILASSGSCVVGDGVNVYMSMPGDPLSVGPITVYTVYSLTDSTSGATDIGLLAPSSLGFALMHRWQSGLPGSMTRTYALNGSFQTVEAISTGHYVMSGDLVIRADMLVPGVGISTNLNGASVAVTADATTTYRLAETGDTADLFAGASRMKGEIHEMIIVARELTTEEHASMLTYLSLKHEVSV